MYILKWCARFFLLSTFIFQQAYALKDLSGKYKCRGIDNKDGIFVGADILTLDKVNSNESVAGYHFTAPNFEGGLTGFAVFDGKSLAIYFYSTHNNTKNERDNYGVGIAQVTKYGLSKVYYQPTYKGGNTGFVNCERIPDLN